MRQRVVAALMVLLAGSIVVPLLFSADPPSSYQVVHGWPHVPDGFTFGEVSAAAVDSHNHVFVAHHPELLKHDDNPIMYFEGATGKLLGSWGAGISWHALTVDNHDNVWAVSAKRQFLCKFSHDGRALLTVGEKDVVGLDGKHFNKPTAVAVTPTGEFYVSDGYENSRVAKFSAKGEFLFDWGRKGAGPGEFDIPHGIALDSQGRVYVADRGNARIQVFDAKGKYLYEWKSAQLGRPWAITVSKDGYVFATDGGETDKDKPLRASVLKLDLKGRILAQFGKLGQYDGQFYWPHGVAVAQNGDVYVTDIYIGRRVQKFVWK